MLKGCPSPRAPTTKPSLWAAAMKREVFARDLIFSWVDSIVVPQVHRKYCACTTFTIASRTIRNFWKTRYLILAHANFLQLPKTKNTIASRKNGFFDRLRAEYLVTNDRNFTLIQPTLLPMERWSNLYDGDSFYEFLCEIVDDRIVSLRSYELFSIRIHFWLQSSALAFAFAFSIKTLSRRIRSS